ncbi:MAG: hypothetical protein HQK49_22325 [Oligoflexia bacterium]|nr:hypothetical protein [Oligoflexia bacterium]
MLKKGQRSMLEKHWKKFFWSIVRKNFLNLHWERMVSFFKTHPIQKNDIVFLGDSIIESGHWAEIYSNKSNYSSLSVRNRGINGDTTNLILKRLSEVISGQPSKVFLLVGTNDLWLGEKIESILNNYQEILLRFKEESTSTKVYVLSILPRENFFNTSIKDLNNRLQELLQNSYDPNYFEYIDIYSAFLANNNNSIDMKYTNDELHLNGDGYIKLHNLLNKYI